MRNGIRPKDDVIIEWLLLCWLARLSIYIMPCGMIISRLIEVMRKEPKNDDTK
jgi:hypothetical protein